MLWPASTPRVSYWSPEPRMKFSSPSRVLASSELNSASRSTGARRLVRADMPAVGDLLVRCSAQASARRSGSRCPTARWRGSSPSCPRGAARRSSSSSIVTTAFGLVVQLDVGDLADRLAAHPHLVARHELAGVVEDRLDRVGAAAPEHRERDERRRRRSAPPMARIRASAGATLTTERLASPSLSCLSSPSAVNRPTPPASALDPRAPSLPPCSTTPCRVAPAPPRTETASRTGCRS